jgi:hypothetical protein
MYLDIKIIMWFNSLGVGYKINEYTNYEDFKNWILNNIKMIMVNTNEDKELFKTTEHFIGVKNVIKCIETYYLHNTLYKPPYLLYESNQIPKKIQVLEL